MDQKADKVRLLSPVLNNLFSNAVKFTECGSVSLVIKKCPDLDFIELGVHDTGKGIPRDRLVMIFEPFRQVEFGDTRTHGGTGLGLTICKKLIEIMGGTLRVESRTDSACQGSHFFFTVPYQPTKAGPFNEPPISGHDHLPNIEMASLRSHRFGKVLLVEDDAVSRKVAKQMIQKAGFDVLQARDGVEAVSLFEQNRDTLDLILMDVMMPVMGGIEATERIREIERTSDTTEFVPIVALSAGAMKGDKERGLAVGMTDYLTKPISRLKLLEALEKYIVHDSGKKAS